jgi:hypothetical protein
LTPNKCKNNFIQLQLQAESCSTNISENYAYVGVAFFTVEKQIAARIFSVPLRC